MKRKLLTLLLVLILAICAVGLVACDNSADNSSSNEQSGWGNVFTIETAYAKAQELGYEGTLEEFLETIKGKDGQDGQNGKDGIDGQDGQNGKDGKDGKDGLGIKKVEIVNGDLIITFTDDSQVNCGEIVVEGATQEETHTVKFECEYAEIPNQKVKHGEKAVKPEVEGYEIEGIYLGEEKWSFIGYSVTQDITLTVYLKGMAALFLKKTLADIL